MPRDWKRELYTLAQAGALTASIDGTFSSVLAAFFYNSTVARLFQGVASTLLGPSALDGGTRTEMIGIAMHIGVAFGWSAVFLFGASRIPAIGRALATRSGAIKVASVYGPCIWLVMSFIVVPFLLQRPPSITIRWWIQLFGHFPFVGLPIVGMVARGLRAGER